MNKPLFLSQKNLRFSLVPELYHTLLQMLGQKFKYLMFYVLYFFFYKKKKRF